MINSRSKKFQIYGEYCNTDLQDGRDVRDNTDYRTSYINGVASLTIEETFVEDTAVYTIRVENGAGVAESSAKLVVKCWLCWPCLSFII